MLLDIYICVLSANKKKIQTWRDMWQAVKLVQWTPLGDSEFCTSGLSFKANSW